MRYSFLPAQRILLLIAMISRRNFLFQSGALAVLGQRVLERPVKLNTGGTSTDTPVIRHLSSLAGDRTTQAELVNLLQQGQTPISRRKLLTTGKNLGASLMLRQSEQTAEQIKHHLETTRRAVGMVLDPVGTWLDRQQKTYKLNPVSNFLFRVRRASPVKLGG